ncbi:hypothetical protein JYU14_03125, partial [Simkania negevensis]|nr:hypothetical protein [Simkania negevensis]
FGNVLVKNRTHVILGCFMAISFLFAAGTDTHVSDSFYRIVEENTDVKLQLSLAPLSYGAVDIVLCDNFSIENVDEQHFSAIWAIRSVAKEHFAKKGYTGFLCYSKILFNKPLELQIVPYSSLPWYLNNSIVRKIYSVWKQAQVLYRTTFPASPPSEKDLREQMVFWTGLNRFLQKTKEKSGSGALTQENVIRNQLIYTQRSQESQDNISLLYNYAPVNTGGEQMHFLLVPSPEKPAKNFLELEESQYTATLTLAKKVAMWAKKEFGDRTVIHFFDKTGEIAGQTQPLYHAHLIIIKKEEEETWGKISMFLRMLIPPSPLPFKELEERVSHYQETLGLFLRKEEVRDDR